MNEPPTQQFRARGSLDTIDIPTRRDPKTGFFVVRWRDILHCFDDTKRIMNGRTVVLYLTDDDLEE
jgi:hypothetical protein